MANSLYIHRIEVIAGHRFIVIEDLNVGFMSVTNDIENVVEEISQKERINPCEHFIIYKDSEGVWDGFDFATQQFVPIQNTDFKTAVSSLIKKATT